MSETTQEALKLAPEQQEQIVEILRVWQSARDALNDDMIGRLAGTLSQSLDTLDRFNRSGIANALPEIAQFVNSGDLKRILSLGRLVAAAEDSLNDDMISRLARVITDSLSILDRLTRDGTMDRIIQMLSEPGIQSMIVRFGDALASANQEFESTPHPKGGIGGLWKLGTDPGNQEAIQFMGLFGKHLRNGNSQGSH